MSKRKSYVLHSTTILNRKTNKPSIFKKREYRPILVDKYVVTLDLLGKFPCTSAFVLRTSFSSPEPIVSFSRGLETRLAAISPEGMRCMLYDIIFKKPPFSSVDTKETSQRLHKNSNLWNCGFGARKGRLRVDAKGKYEQKTFVFTRYVWTGSNREFKMSHRRRQRELYRCSILFSTFLRRHCTTTT